MKYALSGERGQEDPISRDMVEIMGICSICVPEFDKGRCDEVRKARNWDVHTGRAVWEENPQHYLGCCYSVIVQCLGFLNVPREEFFCEDAHVALSFIGAMEREDRAKYDAEVGKARQRYSRLVEEGAVPPPLAGTTPETASPDRLTRTESAECPACKQAGALYFRLWSHSDPVVDPETKQATRKNNYMPTLFYCETCNLRLWGMMLGLAGMDRLKTVEIEIDAFDLLGIDPRTIRERFDMDELLSREELDDMSVGRAEKQRWEDEADEMYDFYRD